MPIAEATPAGRAGVGAGAEAEFSRSRCQAIPRVDVAEGTTATHRVNLRRILPTLGDRRLDEIEPSHVAQLVSQLHGNGLKRESIRKTIATLAMVFDYAGVAPTPRGTS